MKTQITAFVALALFASSSFAQYSSVTEVRLRDRYASQGVRVSLVKPSLSMEVKFSDSDESLTFKENIDSALGLAVGYASLPIQELGYTVNGSLFDLKEAEGSASMFRMDGNLGYAFNSIFNLKGGLNVSFFDGRDSNIKFDPGLGAQASAGFQITKNIGLDLGYIVMNQSANHKGVRIDAKESGPEIALNGTF